MDNLDPILFPGLHEYEAQYRTNTRAALENWLETGATDREVYKHLYNLALQGIQINICDLRDGVDLGHTAPPHQDRRVDGGTVIDWRRCLRARVQLKVVKELGWAFITKQSDWEKFSAMLAQTPEKMDRVIARRAQDISG